MRIQLTALVVTVIVISGATIVGRVVHVISINQSNYEKANSAQADELASREYKKNNIFSDAIGNASEHLIWFLQISDLHLSIFYDEGRLANLEKFASETVSIVKPSVVLASGDLTDAKTIDKLGSRQYLDEWIAYRDVLRKTNVTQKTVWLDIRGNHDNFDVPSLSSDNNFYQKFSVQGQKHLRSYMYTVKKGFDTVSFIAVDACLLPGPRRPFNFIGVLTSKEMELLRSFEKQSRNHNHTIWFGHYPTSCILSPEPGIRNLMAGGLAYMCGHLHTLGGLMHSLYTRQKTGSLELELGDWKDERIFRVAAIDHGLFSFVDVPLDQWPIILITNPKDAMFAMPNNEPLRAVLRSTHIRVLVWSRSPVTEVKVRINNEGKWHVMSHAEGPIYVASWRPLKYAEGTHIIEVAARDASGRRNLVSHMFTLDGTPTQFNFWPRAILMSNVSAVFQFLFGISLFLYIVPLCVVRWLHHRVLAKKMQRPRIQFWICKIWLRKFWVLCCVDRLFWPLIIYSVYLPIGPWFIGEVLDNHVGVVFAWGTIVYNSYLPGSFTFAYGFLQILLFQCPLLFITAHSADLRFQELYMGKNRSLFQFVWRHISYLCLISMQAMNAYFFWLAYGTMALILGPLRTWAVFLGLYMWYFSSSKLKRGQLRTVAEIWGPSVRRVSFGSSSAFNGDRTPTPAVARRGKISKKRKDLDEDQTSL